VAGAGNGVPFNVRRMASSAPMARRRAVSMVDRISAPATIQMTADRYGHLFPRSDDGAEMAAAERASWAAESDASPRTPAAR
jgi:hypothetical protein